VDSLGFHCEEFKPCTPCSRTLDTVIAVEHHGDQVAWSRSVEIDNAKMVQGCWRGSAAPKPSRYGAGWNYRTIRELPKWVRGEARSLSQRLLRLRGKSHE